MGKGENFERKISRDLSLWFSNGKRDDIYWRNRNRSRQINSKYQLGDIVCEVSEGEDLTKLFSIEIKSGYSKTKKGKIVKNIPWDLLDIIDFIEHKDKLIYLSQIEKFWNQTSRDAKLSKREPLLIFKRDFHSPSVMMKRSMYKKLVKYSGIYKNNYLMLFLGGYFYVIMRLEHFFNWVNPETIKLIVKTIEED